MLTVQGLELVEVASPKTAVRITRACYVGGVPRAVGDVVEVEEGVGLELLQMGKCESVDPAFKRRLRSRAVVEWGPPEAPEARAPAASWIMEGWRK